MVNSEDGKSCPAEKPCPPGEQANMHVYPDWATMQAYYGPRIPVPPYFNPAVASGHPPHPYMWTPQSMMTPYGPSYAIYPHGCLYAQPGLPPPNASLGMETPTKSSANSDQSLVKKLKESDGLAMSIGNDYANSAEGGANRGISQSGGETESSSGGSNESSAEADQKGKKRSRDESVSNDEDGEGNPQIGPQVVKEVNRAAARMIMVASADNGNKNSTEMSMALELKTPTTLNANNNIITTQGVPAEPWLQNEREQKREKRKQSNRESARRSRLRKQAEAEELAIKVQSLTAENMAIKSEIIKLAENSKKLKFENTAIMGKLHSARAQTETMSLDDMDDRRQHPVHTADLLAKVDNNSGGSLDENNEEQESYENKRSDAKLYPLGASSRTDAVAAG